MCEEWKERHKETSDDISSRFMNLRFVSLEVWPLKLAIFFPTITDQGRYTFRSYENPFCVLKDFLGRMRFFWGEGVKGRMILYDFVCHIIQW